MSLIRSKLLATVMLAGAAAANADEGPSGSALITCDPEANLFRLESQQKMYSQRAELQPLGYHFARQLRENPFVCELNGLRIEVNAQRTGNIQGVCGAKRTGVRIDVNGTRLTAPIDAKHYRGGGSSSIKEGVIELSDCFELKNTVELKGTAEAFDVSACRLDWITLKPFNIQMGCSHQSFDVSNPLRFPE